MKNELTIIIPFLNEGIEVQNTLQSIREHGHPEINIILINDSSNDSYDYQSVAKKNNATYINNNIRLGVAASRDLGVKICKTPYFLFLDAHMRFYDDKWSTKIIEQLKQEDRCILCCQTKVLKKEKEKIKEENSTSPYGAVICFDENEKLLEATWKYEEYSPETTIEQIPCILGAAYAASKRYWTYLKGLAGLLEYGSDEVYISMKAWLEGGKCLLLKDIVIGHIYRTQPPYTLDPVYSVYNKLWITEMLLTGSGQDRIRFLLKESYKDFYPQALQLIDKHKEQFEYLKQYYSQIFIKKIEDFQVQFSSSASDLKKEDNKNALLKRLANHILLNSSFMADIGLLNGKMGLVIFFSHYALYSKDERFEEFAGELLDELYGEIHTGLPITFNKGLYGIGWGIEYLVQHSFMEGDTDDILEEIDRKVMERDPLRMDDYSLHTGIGGLLHYVVARLLSKRDTNVRLPFDRSFLTHLAKSAKTIIADVQKFENHEIACTYLDLYEKKAIQQISPEIYKIVSSRVPEGDDIIHWAIGLEKGCAGKGLKMMLT